MTVIKVYWKVGSQLCGRYGQTDDSLAARKQIDESIVKEGPQGQRTACLALVTPCEVK